MTGNRSEMVERLQCFREMLFHADAMALKPTKPSEVETTQITTRESRLLQAALADAIEALAAPCRFCGQPENTHEPSGCCGDGGGSTFEAPNQPLSDSVERLRHGLRQPDENMMCLVDFEDLAEAVRAIAAIPSAGGVETEESLGAVSGSRPSDQAPAGLGGSRFDPARLRGWCLTIREQAEVIDEITAFALQGSAAPEARELLRQVSNRLWRASEEIDNAHDIAALGGGQ